MKADQFVVMSYQWLFDKILPSVAPAMWQRQAIAFKKGREILTGLAVFAETLTNAEGNIDLDDAEKRIDEMFKIDPKFAYPINEPMLAFIKINPEFTLEFTKEDATKFISFLRGSTSTTEVTL